eukprot:TRINITY_DN1343_c0_g3_i2.p1 TRINITY_DN1343_c0_g3~~TRINITY_DN1343_c0_g3_i2.p1  ORF type:complete len:239 (+),score=11.22 TRINITY_DN1343_c0_g3_i2:162-878(+)
MDYQVAALHSIYTKRLGYDPLDCSYISVVQRKFNKRMQELLWQPHGGSTSGLLLIKERRSNSLVNAIDFPAAKGNSVSIKRALPPLRARKHPVGRNILALKAGTEDIGMQKNTGIVNIKTLCFNLGKFKDNHKRSDTSFDEAGCKKRWLVKLPAVRVEQPHEEDSDRIPNPLKKLKKFKDCFNYRTHIQKTTSNGSKQDRLSGNRGKHKVIIINDTLARSRVRNFLKTDNSRSLVPSN